ncbi:MAG: ABC transporter ATP-binding protein [Synergistaceae bacterium]|jgi:peptide/nickel transport system ATP-binding protein|nr:ABC transporter ATP-binding protein [Synergistaceae bacterium]
MRDRGKSLDINGLKTYFYTDAGVVKAVDDVSFSVAPGETVCLVGESGCGKSVASLSILRLVDEPGAIVGGSIAFDGVDVLTLSLSEMADLRGKEIAMIFQEPMSALNPVMSIGTQISESLMRHLGIYREEALEKSSGLLREMGIPRPREILQSYPHELSGGILQRVMIAIAISCGPSLLIADEPTTALDVTTQAQILTLLRSLKQEYGMSMLFVTHDLGVVAELADTVVVMYAGKIVEKSPAASLFDRPLHPYTSGLLKCKPRIDEKQERLYAIPGQVPELSGLDAFCYYADRCEYATNTCRQKMPPRFSPEISREVSCWKYEK